MRRGVEGGEVEKNSALDRRGAGNISSPEQVVRPAQIEQHDGFPAGRRMFGRAIGTEIVTLESEQPSIRQRSEGTHHQMARLDFLSGGSRGVEFHRIGQRQEINRRHLRRLGVINNQKGGTGLASAILHQAALQHGRKVPVGQEGQTLEAAVRFAARDKRVLLIRGEIWPGGAPRDEARGRGKAPHELPGGVEFAHRRVVFLGNEKMAVVRHSESFRIMTHPSVNTLRRLSRGHIRGTVR